MDMDINQTLENENCGLIERVKRFEDENDYLNSEVSALRNSLEKQKNLYRKFSDDVVESERRRNEAFRSQKRSLVEENTLLIIENRQLKTDVLFYKKAFEELAKEDELTHAKNPNQQSPIGDIALITEKEPLHVKRLTRTQTKTTHESTSATAIEFIRSPQATLQDCKHKSSRALSKVNEKLFADNKKHKLKITSLSATVQLLKTKNRQLENYKNKIINKKLKFTQEADELDRLLESTKLKNRDIFNSKILAKLDELCK